MVHIYMYTRYFNITGTDGAVDFLVQAMFHIISADRVNFWVEDNNKEGGMYSAYKDRGSMYV